jgi:hypothetical protein
MKTYRCTCLAVDAIRPTLNGFDGGLPVKAETVHAAARIFAERVAQAQYGQIGIATLVLETAERGTFRAFIGVYQGDGITRGTTATIKII